MEYTQHITNIKLKQKAYFKTQNTKDVSQRLRYLKLLKKEILSREQEIYDALYKDFGKSPFETFLTETGLVISEIDLAIDKLKQWAKPERVNGNLLIFPSKSYIYKEPYGTALIIGPWNYPFQLSISPLIMAIAAGNTVVLKPSELTPNTSQLISNIVAKVFPEGWVTTVQGGIPIATELLAQRWDYIFFTGSSTVGKIVAQSAAKHLTPVTLELGGKSPCIIDETANLKLVVKRLVWGKFLNGGQTCVAPDYLIVKSSIKNALIEHLKTAITKAYGNAKNSEDYPRIINEKNFLRLTNMLKDVNIVFGGDYDEKELYISPTLVYSPNLNNSMMKEEIFGPILPILTFESPTDLENIIWSYEKPLAFYMFSNKKEFVKETLDKFSFGDAVINDTLIHIGNENLPFGGVGASGIGAYHGKHGFNTFSHHKSVVKRGNWIDPPFRYAPYKGKLKLIKTVFKWFS